MKKITALILSAIMTVSLAACGAAGESGDGSAEAAENSAEETISESTEAVPEENEMAGTEASAAENETAGIEAAQEENETTGTEAEPGDTETTAAQGSRVLVAYFSWADNAVLTEEADAVSSPSVIPPGNVQQLAGWVQEETGGDLFSIQVTEPYPDSWDECLSRANQEQGEDARPELVQNVENLEQYNTVFLGYPNWWYGVPMALLSFLEQNDLSGKQIYLFCSHGTGGLANSVEIISEAIPEAEISDSIFDCYEEGAASSRELIQEWVEEAGY